jgi:hypothetical protein
VKGKNKEVGRARFRGMSVIFKSLLSVCLFFLKVAGHAGIY